MGCVDVALETHIAGLRRYARALVGRQSESDELVQECLVRALGRIDGSYEIKDLRAYLFSILHNCYIDYTRERRRFVEYRNVAALGMNVSPPSQEAHLELRDLDLALQAIPEEQRQVVLLVGLEGMSYQAVASVLSIPIGTVMSRLSRGREALRRMMDSREAVPLRRTS
jgi:RNA polymerase sigma-70 factor (ECF subfamily)